MNDPTKIAEIFQEKDRKFGEFGSFGDSQRVMTSIFEALQELIEMRNKKVLPKMSTEENGVIDRSIRRADSLLEEIKGYDGKDSSKREVLKDEILKLEAILIPLYRSIVSSPEKGNELVKVKDEIAGINSEIKKLNTSSAKFENAISDLRRNLLEDTTNTLGKEFGKTANRALGEKIFWGIVILAGVVWFYCEASRLAGVIHEFIKEDKTKYEIILMLLLERTALIFIPAICVYFGMKQFSAAAHIRIQNLHKKNIGAIFSSIFKATQYSSLLEEKSAELVIKMAEEYPDGYVSEEGVRLKSLKTPIGEAEVKN